MILETGSGAIELSAATAAELARRLGRFDSSRPFAAAFEDAGAVLELDEAQRQAVFAELTYWLDSVGPASFPADARQLFRALAGEAVPGRPA